MYERRIAAGSIILTESQIIWRQKRGSDITINLNDVVIVGEYTTNAISPYSNWFITFVYHTGEWDNISIYSEGIKSIREHLAEFYKIDFSKQFESKLLTWRSFIRHPQIAEGKELFLPLRKDFSPKKIKGNSSGWKFSTNKANSDISSSNMNTKTVFQKIKNYLAGWSFFEGDSEYFDSSKDHRSHFELTEDAKEILKSQLRK